MGRIQDLALLARRLDIAAGRLVDHIRTQRRGEARPMPAPSAVPASPSENLVLRAQIDAHCTLLADAGDVDALKVVEHIARRAVLGCKQYGPLKLGADPRDWRQEAREEAADGLFYMTCLELERGR